jgi:hypothetical protein
MQIFALLVYIAHSVKYVSVTAGTEHCSCSVV